MSRKQQLTYAQLVVDTPTLDQFHGGATPTVDLTRGPPLPCPQRLLANLYRCVDLWVDGNGGPRRTACTGCSIGQQRRAGIAPPLDAPELRELEPRKPRPSELAAAARKLLNKERAAAAAAARRLQGREA